MRRERGRSNLPQQLVLVGKKAGLYGETLKAVEEEGVGDSVVINGYVSDGDLPALSTGARSDAPSRNSSKTLPRTPNSARGL